MASYNKFNITVQDLAQKVHNLNADALKIMLSNAAPIAANAVKADITEIGAGNGYSAGGNTPTNSGCTQSGGIAKLVLQDTVFTASAGSIGPFRYVVLYNSTPGAGPLIGWFDYGSSITLNAGETFTVDLDQSNGTLTIQ